MVSLEPAAKFIWAQSRVFHTTSLPLSTYTSAVTPLLKPEPVTVRSYPRTLSSSFSAILATVVEPGRLTRPRSELSLLTSLVPSPLASPLASSTR